MLQVWSRWSGLEALQSFLDAHAHLHGMALVEAALKAFDARYLVDDIERERIPQQGRVLVVANHPLGGLDALLLMKCLADVRPDIKVVANDLLTSIPGLRSLLLPVPVLGGQAARRDLTATHDALAAEQAVLVFPAGAVSRLNWRGVADLPWQKGFVSIAQKAGAPILPMFLEARNSPAFYAASMVAHSLGTVMLPREMTTRRGLRAPIHIGQPLPTREVAEIPGSRIVKAQKLREVVHDLPNGRAHIPVRTEALRHKPDLRFVMRELDALTNLGRTPDGKRILLGRLDPSSALTRELAIARERTFRAVGEGTGLGADTDRFDAHYEQILLWDDVKQNLVGGYRVARCEPVLAQKGVSGLYTASLFQFQPELVERLGDAMELGRSFVVPEYWGSRSLDYLWSGIGAYLRQYPHIRYLFGPVSMSADLPKVARRLMVAYYRRYFGARSGLATARHPFDTGVVPAVFRQLDQRAAETLLKQNLTALGVRVPTLYKQYVELCEPGGVQFLDFGTDPAFCDAVDGLVWVDLATMHARKRARYLETSAAA
ncbi:MAG: lysophospholipid acyltransferase family protein [Ahniella sp.]|nr:lysophospholipid acyltransferase family protein [Ahniella sp.]